MYVGSGTSKLRHASRTLRTRWDDTEESWRDSVREDFERTRLEPLDTQANLTLRAMQALCDVLARAYRDCS